MKSGSFRLLEHGLFPLGSNHPELSALARKPTGPFHFCVDGNKESVSIPVLMAESQMPMGANINATVMFFISFVENL